MTPTLLDPRPCVAIASAVALMGLAAGCNEDRSVVAASAASVTELASTARPGIDEPGGDDAAPPPGIATASSTATATHAAYPPDMVLVEGDACSDVRQDCLEWLDDPALPYARCARYAPDPQCIGTRTPMRFLMDRDELSLPGERLPASDLNFVKASSLCRSRGRRLCLESEWTFACEGEEMRPYPYGWERRPVCNQDREGLLGPGASLADQHAPADAFPECVSPFGVRNMVGNVDELVVNDKPDRYRNLLKGGWWAPVRNRCRVATAGHDDYFHELQIGTRCCADAEDVPEADPAQN